MGLLPFITTPVLPSDALLAYDVLTIFPDYDCLFTCFRFRVQGSGFRVQVSGFRVQGTGFRVQGSGFWIAGPGFRVISGFRVQGAGFRVSGAGSMAPDAHHVRRFNLFRGTSLMRNAPLLGPWSSPLPGDL
jgi:hypothetical protein